MNQEVERSQPVEESVAARQRDLNKSLVPLQHEPLWNGCGQPAAIHSCVIVKHRARQVVTAMHTLHNQLRLFSWRVNADGTVICTGTTEGIGEGVAQIALIQVAPDHAEQYLVGWRTEHGAVYLQSWAVSNTGAFYADGAALCIGEALTWFQLCMLCPSQLLLLGLEHGGGWQLSSWQLTESTVTPLHTATMAAVNGAMAVGLQPQTLHPGAEYRFTTLGHVGWDRLRWTDWCCSSSGELEVICQREYQLPNIIDIVLTTVGTAQVALLHSATGQLDLWAISEAATDTPPELDVAVDPMPSALTTVATDVRDFTVASDADGLLIAYTVMHAAPSVVKLLRTIPPSTPPTPWTVTPLGELPVAQADQLALCDHPLEGNAPLLTVVGKEDGGVQLTTWGSG